LTIAAEAASRGSGASARRRWLPVQSGVIVSGQERAMTSSDSDILQTAEAWARAGRKVAIATVAETWGSAPRPVGSHLVIDQEGRFLGSVSGGCVEGAVVSEALDVIEDGRPRMLEFGVADETAWQVGLSCGGRIKVYVERVS
jgi:xanthine/CO dehydrogenase XdhC/CoxF family maturation factor